MAGLPFLTTHTQSFCWLALGLGAVVGCSTTPELDIMVHEAPQGAVYLERVPDRSFQATHPITLDPGVIRRVLQGVIVQESSSSVPALFNPRPTPVRAFTEEEVAFLSPLIATALSNAAADQQVGFRVINRSSTASYAQAEGAGLGSSEPPLRFGVPETTSGSLFVHGLSLHLTLAQYRHRPERADTINMANRRLPDPSGLTNRVVLFTPDTAKRPDSYRTAGASDDTVVIDYERLATLPSAPPPSLSTGPVQSPPASKEPLAPATQSGSSSGKPVDKARAPDEELRGLKEQMNKKDAEMKALQKELQEIRRELTEQATERDKSKNTPQPAAKSPE